MISGILFVHDADILFVHDAGILFVHDADDLINSIFFGKFLWILDFIMPFFSTYAIETYVTMSAKYLENLLS